MKKMKNDENLVREAGSNVYIIGNRCYRCGHEWRPNRIDVAPRVCPSCKSPYWDRPRSNGTNT